MAAQVLTSLGADLDRVRQQVVQLLSGHQPPEAGDAVEGRFVEHRDGPRGPACRSRLYGQVGYRVLAASPIEASEITTAIDVVF